MKFTERTLLVGIHTHRHGESIYPFILEPGAEFDRDIFIAYLAEDWEPDRDEDLTWDTWPTADVPVLE